MKKFSFLIILLSITTIVFGQGFTENTKKTITQCGIVLGSVTVVVNS